MERTWADRNNFSKPFLNLCRSILSTLNNRNLRWEWHILGVTAPLWGYFPHMQFHSSLYLMVQTCLLLHYGMDAQVYSKTSCKIKRNIFDFRRSPVEWVTVTIRPQVWDWGLHSCSVPWTLGEGLPCLCTSLKGYYGRLSLACVFLKSWVAGDCCSLT